MKEATYEQKQEGSKRAYEYAKEIGAQIEPRRETMVVAAYMAGWVTALESNDS